MGNRDQCIQVSDRRLSNEKGRPIRDPEGKATHLYLDDSRFVCGFAGLALAGSFRAAFWVPEALVTVAGPAGYTGEATLRAFTDACTRRFREPDLRRVSSANKGFSVMFTGYLDLIGPPQNLVAALISNFQNFESGRDEAPRDEFELTLIQFKAELDPDDQAYVQRIGRWDVLPEDTPVMRKARQALNERRDLDTLVNIGVGAVRQAASRPEARETIGVDLSVAVVPAERPQWLAAEELSIPVEWGYKPASASEVMYGVNLVLGLERMQLAAAEPKIEPASEINQSVEPMVVPKVGRNALCPCGSGEKFKYCHGSRRN